MPAIVVRPFEPSTLRSYNRCMSTDLERLAHRLTHLEREMRFWRALAFVGLAAGLAASCDGSAPTERLSELLLESSDGTHRVRVRPDGITVEGGEHTAWLGADALTFQTDPSHDVTNFGLAGVTLQHEDETQAYVGPHSIFVASGSARAALSVEGTSGSVQASGAHASSSLSASEGSASLELRPEGPWGVLAAAGADSAAVTLTGAEGARHTYGPFDSSH